MYFIAVFVMVARLDLIYLFSGYHLKYCYCTLLTLHFYAPLLYAYENNLLIVCILTVGQYSTPTDLQGMVFQPLLLYDLTMILLTYFRPSDSTAYSNMAMPDFSGPGLGIIHVNAQEPFPETGRIRVDIT